MAEATPRGRDESAIAHLQDARFKAEILENIAENVTQRHIELFAGHIRCQYRQGARAATRPRR